MGWGRGILRVSTVYSKRRPIRSPDILVSIAAVAGVDTAARMVDQSHDSYSSMWLVSRRVDHHHQLSSSASEGRHAARVQDLHRFLSAAVRLMASYESRFVQVLISSNQVYLRRVDTSEYWIPSTVGKSMKCTFIYFTILYLTVFHTINQTFTFNLVLCNVTCLNVVYNILTQNTDWYHSMICYYCHRLMTPSTIVKSSLEWRRRVMIIIIGDVQSYFSSGINFSFSF